MSSTCPHNTANFGPLTAETSSGVWGTQQISTGFPSCLRYCRDVTHRRPTKLRTMFGRLLGWYTIYTFLGAVAPGRILSGAKFTLRPSLAFAYIGSVTARHSSSGRQPNFAASYKDWNYGTFAKGLYSVGRPSRWASAHITVLICKSGDVRYKLLCLVHACGGFRDRPFATSSTMISAFGVACAAYWHSLFLAMIAVFVPVDIQLKELRLELAMTRSPAIAEGPRDAGVPVEIW